MTERETYVLDTAAANRAELETLLSELVQCDTTNSIDSGREAEIIPILRKHYSALGLKSTVYCPDDLPGILENPDYRSGRGTDKRPNIDAYWPGVGCGENASGRNKKIMLAAHTDVMPSGDSRAWDDDPFSGRIADGRIYGRGSCDDKFGLAAAIYAIRILQRARLRLRADIVLNGYCDEEYGGGNGALAACLRDPCDTYINLDGGNYEIWVSSIGGCVVHCQVRAQTPQDSVFPALEAMDRVRDELRAFADRRRAELRQDPLYMGTDMERSAFRALEMRSGDNGCDLDRASLDFVFYTTQQRETIEAEFAHMSGRLKSLLASIDFEFDGFEQTSRFFHYLQSDPNDAAIDALHQAASEVAGRPVVRTGACLSDLSLFLKHGSRSSCNFGLLRDFRLPGGAHQPNEFADCDELLQVAQALILFLMRHGEALPEDIAKPIVWEE